MKTAETINIVCSELGITKADPAKRMGSYKNLLVTITILDKVIALGLYFL